MGPSNADLDAQFAAAFARAKKALEELQLARKDADEACAILDRLLGAPGQPTKGGTE